jgi:hypothetical protein
VDTISLRGNTIFGQTNELHQAGCELIEIVAWLAQIHEACIWNCMVKRTNVVGGQKICGMHGTMR